MNSFDYGSLKSFKEQSMKTQIILEGALNPIEWDEDGNPKTFSIYTADDEDFIIKNYPKPKKLRKLLNKRVQAHGKIGSNCFGEKVIFATKVKAVKSPVSPASMERYPINELWAEGFTAHLPKEHPLYGPREETFYWEAS